MNICGVCNTAKYLVSLEDAATEMDDDKALMKILQYRYKGRPHHHTTSEHEVMTYYVVIEDTQLGHYKQSNYQTLELASWQQGLTRVHQHLHFIERVQGALDYCVALVNNTIAENQNVYPHILITHGLTGYYYKRDDSDYRKLKNHSDQALQMTT